MSCRRRAGRARHIATTLAALLLLSPRAGRAAAGAAPPIAVVSALGDVRANGAPLTPGTAPGRAATVKLGGRGATTQLLVSGVLAVALWGRGSARIDTGGPAPRVALQGAAISARLSGRGRAITAGGWRLALDPGSSLIVEQRQLLVLRGHAVLDAPAGTHCAPASAPSSSDAESAATQPASRPDVAPRRARAGERVSLGADGCFSVGPGAPAAETVAASASHAPPPPWSPASALSFSTEAVRAVQVMRAEQRTEQETAACGCTESGGATAGPVGQGAAGEALERRNATLRVRVTGVPRGGSR